MEDNEHDDPAYVVEMWRLDQARRLGVPMDVALELARSSGELSLLRRLIAGGCDPEVAGRIVC